LDLGRYRKCRARIVSKEETARWKRHFVAGAAAHVMRSASGVSLPSSPPPMPLCRSVSALTLADMIGISGGNFASTPLAGADWQRWRSHDRGSASLKFISDRQRRILLDTVTASRDVSLLVARFDTVFNNNMPRGLCMINVVCNRRPRKL
jgi:hypothetical protein